MALEKEKNLKSGSEPIMELKLKCQKKKPPIFWRDKFLRSVSIRFTKLFLLMGMNANNVSALVFIFGITSAFFYMNGEYAYSLIALLLHHLHFIFDGCDGEVARYRKTTELEDNRGVYLDLMSHMVVYPLLVMGMAIGVYRDNPLSIPDSTFLILGFVGAYSLMLTNFASTKKYELFVKKNSIDVIKSLNKTLKGEDGKKINWIKEEIWFLLSFELFNLMFIFTILNAIWVLVIFYAVIFPLNAIRKFYFGYKNIDRIG